ncbi:MAG: TetR/AcrR family transcriptional regulator [Nocardioidaceae bacterium]
MVSPIDPQWWDSPVSGLRKLPQQQRSRERVVAVLDAAEHILATDGVEGLTMRRLSDEAGVPVGTLYQFFVDKQGVVDALVHRHGEATPVLMVEMEQLAADSLPWREILTLVIDRQIRRLRADPAYVAVWANRDLSAQAQREDDRDIETMTDLLRRLLQGQEGLPDTPTLRAYCRVAIQAADSLMHLAFRVDPEGDDVTLVELKRILLLYLDSVVAELPRDPDRG